ncbi:HDIG domain-containing protein [bacterium]|nr:HDIG domain-containing protein [bacterium]
MGLSVRDKILLPPRFWYFLVMAVVVTLLYPKWGEEEVFFKEGEVSQEEIIAPFTFKILKSKSEIEREKALIKQSSPLVLLFSDSVASAQNRKLSDFWRRVEQLRSLKLPLLEKVDSLKAMYALSDRTCELLLSTRKTADIKDATRKEVQGFYRDGLLDDKVLLQAETKVATVKKGNRETLIPLANLTSSSEAARRIREDFSSRFEGYADKEEAASEIAIFFLKPNLIPDFKETEERLKLALSNINPYKGTVLKDEKIVGKHERITKDIQEKLLSLEAARRGQKIAPGAFRTVLQVIFRFIIVVVLFSVLYFYLYFVDRKMLTNKRYLLFFLGLVLVLMGINLVIGMLDMSSYLVPVCFATIALTLLFSPRTAIPIAILLPLLVGFYNDFQFPLTFSLLIVSLASVFLFFDLKERSRIYIPILALIVLSVVCVSSLGGLMYTPWKKVLENSGLLVLNLFFSSSVAIVLLTPLERLLGRTTHFTLADLNSTNHTLLQQLSVEAPGTFHHSMLVATLAEAAAEEIGADRLLARVGALFHDIGKIYRPYYFYENSRGRDRHASLTPRESAAVIVSHVKDGVELARAHKLPLPVVNIIQEHHGTSVVEYFYKKSLSRGGNPGSKDEFRYPGPKPRSKEAAIVMISDASEAAVRSLDDPTDKEIAELVHSIIWDRLKDGQFSDSGLTLTEVGAVESRLIRVLEGLHHSRKNYREDVE